MYPMFYPPFRHGYGSPYYPFPVYPPGTGCGCGGGRYGGYMPGYSYPSNPPYGGAYGPPPQSGMSYPMFPPDDQGYQWQWQRPRRNNPRVWESPESPESPWFRAYQNQEKNEKEEK